jgi:hypothetical protein
MLGAGVAAVKTLAGGAAGPESTLRIPHPATETIRTGERDTMYTVRRFDENPIIHPGLDDAIGTNINGPSLVRAPSWLPNALGRYYLYFAHHQGTFIRLATADDLHGPWRVHRPGTLRLEETACRGHIASPDVHIDEAKREIVMYFHGPTENGQKSFVATSTDGLRFEARRTVLGPPYFRTFTHDGGHYCVCMTQHDGVHGALMRSPDGRAAYEHGSYFLPRQRHVALLKRGNLLHIFFSRGQDNPERILRAEMPLVGDWRTWAPGEPAEVLRPERPYEGGDLPMEASRFGAIHSPAPQLRDPGIFEEDGRTYLLYSCAGETGIGIGELI